MSGIRNDSNNRLPTGANLGAGASLNNTQHPDAAQFIASQSATSVPNSPKIKAGQSVVVTHFISLESDPNARPGGYAIAGRDETASRDTSPERFMEKSAKALVEDLQRPISEASAFDYIPSKNLAKQLFEKNDAVIRTNYDRECGSCRDAPNRQQ